MLSYLEFWEKSAYFIWANKPSQEELHFRPQMVEFIWMFGLFECQYLKDRVNIYFKNELIE